MGRAAGKRHRLAHRNQAGTGPPSAQVSIAPLGRDRAGIAASAAAARNQSRRVRVSAAASIIRISFCRCRASGTLAVSVPSQLPVNPVHPVNLQTRSPPQSVPTPCSLAGYHGGQPVQEQAVLVPFKTVDVVGGQQVRTRAGRPWPGGLCPSPHARTWLTSHRGRARRVDQARRGAISGSTSSKSQGIGLLRPANRPSLVAGRATGTGAGCRRSACRWCPSATA